MVTSDCLWTNESASAPTNERHAGDEKRHRTLGMPTSVEHKQQADLKSAQQDETTFIDSTSPMNPTATRPTQRTAMCLTQAMATSFNPAPRNAEPVRVPPN
ncbi:MAG TPA: hypothetical protein VJS30_27015 [Paraburkholderia sp.]|nr:hypothetical protein [Paraburkholderia sp.]